MRIVTIILAMVLAGNFLAAAEGTSIIYLRPADAINLNPWQADDIYSTEIALNIFEGLVRVRKNTTSIEPCLATSWKVSDDGRHWRFILRRGVKFHDNSPFDARSVIDSFRSRFGEKQLLYPRLSFLFSFITDIRSSDPFSVDISLDRPYAPFLIAVADAAAFIQAPAASSSSPYLPVGTGPFRYASWSRDKSLILTRNPDYWAGAGNVEKIIFKVMPDSLGRLLQIKNGSADMTVIQSAKEYEELSLRNEIAILSKPSITTHYLGFNTRKKPFDRREVRAAFLHIISKESMVKQIYQKLAEPAYSPLPLPIVPGGNPAPTQSFDLKAARALLKTAGLENGFDCTLHFPDGQEGIQEIADLLAIYAKKIKINIKRIKLPFAELVRIANRGEHDLLLMGWSSNPDPDFFLYPLFTFSPGNRNRFFYENPELTRLLDLGKITLDAQKRSRIYQDALAILKHDIPWIPLFHLVRTMACNKRISGLGFNPLGQILFRDVKLESNQ
ncbi:MAG: ABC transporter substrate-binding protein [Candidatus Aminicenantes bacterium]|nr:ABC transporter substrate-binding protein [Candidatus Aminicenantes bacterium]